MSNKTLDMPEEALVNMLKALPEDALVEIFWRTLVESNVSPLTGEKKEKIREGTIEYKRGWTPPSLKVKPLKMNLLIMVNS
ncbi:MAG: hypothetical protein AABY74_00380 [Planctomycetota bacterium]